MLNSVKHSHIKEYNSMIYVTKRQRDRQRQTDRRKEEKERKEKWEGKVYSIKKNKYNSEWIPPPLALPPCVVMLARHASILVMQF